MRRFIVTMSLAGCTLLFGQTDSQSITIVASRNAILHRDQVTLSIDMDAPLSATLDDVVAAVGTIGISAANLVDSGLLYANGPSNVPLANTWSFVLAVPLTVMAPTIAAVDKVKRSLANKGDSWSLGFDVTGPQVSSQALAAQPPCTVTRMVAEARAQAVRLADAAGMNVGDTLDVSELVITPYAGFISGSSPPGQFANASINELVGKPIPQPRVCFIQVKFALLSSQ